MAGILGFHVDTHVTEATLKAALLPEKGGKLSTQVLSFLLYNVSCYMYIFICPT